MPCVGYRVVECVCGDCIYLADVFSQCLQLQAEERQGLMVAEMH